MTPLRVLILEDSEVEAALLLRALRDGGHEPAWERVETAAALATAVDRQPWDVILAANVLARLTVRDALAVVRGRELDVPVIVLSRQRGERTAIEAVEAMRAGACDYLLMRDLSRLAPAVERELRATAGRAARHRAESALRRLVKAVETVGIGITVTDVQGRIVYTNPAEARMHGYTAEELVGTRAQVLAPPPARQGVAPERLAALKGWRRESFNMRKDGSVFPVQLVSDVVTDASGTPIGIVTCCVDISERRQAEAAQRASEARYRKLFDRNLAGVYRATAEGAILECNDALARILGWSSRAEVRSRKVADFYFRKRDLKRVMDDLYRLGTLAGHEIELRRRDGSPVWVLANASLLEEGGGPVVVEGTLVDITHRKLARRQLEYQAHHDALTRLPNRALLEQRLTAALRHAERGGGSLALVYLDVDRLKAINDTLGHDAGDALLRSLGDRLTSCLRREDTVARVGGDEFVVLLPAVRTRQEATGIALKILKALAARFQLEGREIQVTSSLGIALYPEDGRDAATLRRQADAALYRAKQLGRNTYRFSSSDSAPDSAQDSAADSAPGSGSDPSSGRGPARECAPDSAHDSGQCSGQGPAVAAASHQELDPELRRALERRELLTIIR
ncbi:MAG TPA: diguanylate cyclase [Thermoanaerobaculia bacterium]|nr:diguanylate cyclase [Thermoanaerobaculia bacterium]